VAIEHSLHLNTLAVGARCKGRFPPGHGSDPGCVGGDQVVEEWETIGLGRTMSLDEEEKIVRKRLSVLKLAERLGSVSEACRQRGVSRTQFYEYRRRFQTHGLSGLRNLPPIHHSHPVTTAPDVEARVVTLSLEHPSWGCDRLSDRLALEGIRISGRTVQRILTDHGMNTCYHRWLKLEEQQARESLELTAEQVKFLEKQNPCFRERHVESSRPGELICQDTFLVGMWKDVDLVYLHAAVDTHNSYGFAFLHTAKQPEAAVDLLHNNVLPFYQERQVPVTAILTCNNCQYCGTGTHPYELYLALNDVEHRRSRVRDPQTNGFAERFKRTILDEFFRIASRTKSVERVEQLQTDLDAWLVYYNTGRPHQGYRNMGRRPVEVLNAYLKERALAEPAVTETVRDDA
jgi:transposase InsO family protein